MACLYFIILTIDKVVKINCTVLDRTGGLFACGLKVKDKERAGVPRSILIVLHVNKTLKAI